MRLHFLNLKSELISYSERTFLYYIQYMQGAYQKTSGKIWGRLGGSLNGACEKGTGLSKKWV